MESIVFTGLHFFVRDMEASRAFYRRLGFEVPDDPNFAVFEFGNNVRVALATYALTASYHAGWKDPGGAGAVALQFDLPSREAVDALHADLVGAGYRSEMAPFDAFWGTRYAEVRDPDGNVVGFHSPRDESRVTPPPGLG
jgi:predicted lactoylglutathione lyase